MEARMKPHNTWRSIPSGIPRDPLLRRRKLAAIQADLARPKTPENDAEDAARIARQVAKDLGLGQLV
jgi:hypothetical protein